MDFFQGFAWQVQSALALAVWMLRGLMLPGALIMHITDSYLAA